MDKDTEIEIIMDLETCAFELAFVLLINNKTSPPAYFVHKVFS